MNWCTNTQPLTDFPIECSALSLDSWFSTSNDDRSSSCSEPHGIRNSRRTIDRRTRLLSRTLPDSKLRLYATGLMDGWMNGWTDTWMNYCITRSLALLWAPDVHKLLTSATYCSNTNYGRWSPQVSMQRNFHNFLMDVFCCISKHWVKSSLLTLWDGVVCSDACVAAL